MFDTISIKPQIHGRDRNFRVNEEKENPLKKILKYIEARHLNLFELLDKDLIHDPSRLNAHCEAMKKVTGHNDFNDEGDGGRGRAYREYQLRNPLAREVGDRKLLQMLENCPAGLSIRAKGVDIIGGNGTTARVAKKLLDLGSRPYIISADPNLEMVSDALVNHELPAVWQSAQSSLFASDTLDFVLGTRGLHHVDRAFRRQLAEEAYRTIKPGGLIILIDVEENSPSAKWYSEAIDRYSITGHRFEHFTKAEFRQLLLDAGFRHITVQNMYDPFIFYGSSWEAARNSLLSHLLNMFGLVNLEKRSGESESDFWERIQITLAPYSTFSGNEISFETNAVNHFSIRPVRAGLWRAEYPRIVLCASGYK